ncbi:putative signal peptide transmembrane protein [Burkholderia thailandensis MSMB121]|uniref:hypothetical protein n=1 Tax=Burkholderia humptydooensis TaxID=430531 RepID=UPI0003280359|nr:hypothetical protein [Burkholderia humptydooensis]AGK51011.1 putative signal peptide transmembrane protein [Burkholderia thailandensis MSMB121]ATF33765.1 signal peptide protein [Burkholderia thailandensis]KST71845.1 signal peptide protein [Burkholderia humptydooensis]
MPIFVVLFAFVALIWGAVHTFHAIAARFGDAVAIGAAAVAADATAAVIARWVRRRRDVAPNAREDGWTHVLQRAWGDLRVSATKGLLWLSQDGADGRYTLTDLSGCRAQALDGRWYLVVAVRDERRAEWTLPMDGKRDALRWERVLTLAKRQRL